MGSHGDGVVTTVEDDELCFEENITIDLEWGCGCLETTEACYKKNDQYAVSYEIHHGWVNLLVPAASILAKEMNFPGTTAM